MKSHEHFLISFFAGSIYLFLTGRQIDLTSLMPWFIGGVLIDIDHLFTYSKRNKTFRLIKLTKLIIKDYKLNNQHIFIFHTIEFAIFLSFMVIQTSLSWQYLASYLLHMGCDFLREKRRKNVRFWLKKRSLAYYIRASKNN